MLDYNKGQRFVLNFFPFSPRMIIISLIYSFWNLIPIRIVYPSVTWAWHSSAQLVSHILSINTVFSSSRGTFLLDVKSLYGTLLIKLSSKERYLCCHTLTLFDPVYIVMFAHNPGDGIRHFYLSPLMFWHLGVLEPGWEFLVVNCYDSHRLCFTFTEASFGYEQIVSTGLLFYY